MPISDIWIIIYCQDWMAKHLALKVDIYNVSEALHKCFLHFICLHSRYHVWQWQNSIHWESKSIRRTSFTRNRNCELWRSHPPRCNARTRTTHLYSPAHLLIQSFGYEHKLLSWHPYPQNEMNACKDVIYPESRSFDLSECKHSHRIELRFRHFIGNSIKCTDKNNIPSIWKHRVPSIYKYINFKLNDSSQKLISSGHFSFLFNPVK